MAWKWDAPSGVYKDHALSSNIREAAVADSLFTRFARVESGYGARRGQSITITRVFPLPLAHRISETDRLPSGRPLIDTKTVTVSEWGFKIETTEFERNLTHFDLQNPMQGALRDQMRLTLDKMVADAFKQTPIKAVPTASGLTVDTDGSPSEEADVNFSIRDLREIHDYLSGDLKAPSYRQGRYIGILSTRAARGIKNDDEYKDWQAPTTSGPFMDGRMRDVEGFMLWETNHFNALENSLGANGVLGEAVFFGADPVFLGQVQEPELRAGIPQDLGRFREMGWVGTVEAGLTWDVPAHARVVHVTST